MGCAVSWSRGRKGMVVSSGGWRALHLLEQKGGGECEVGCEETRFSELTRRTRWSCRLIFSQDVVQGPAAAGVVGGAAQVLHDELVGATGFFQCVGEDRQIVEFLRVVDGCGEFP